MNTNIFIPTKINVGFQNRQDTYTGKLAYVIYFDEKGKLRKETSWQNWRDESIPNEVFDNEPTEGFVLNKKVGGYKTHWNPRQTYTRVYDPRGFEFEITIPNLLWILENCDCIKGKGLQGEFVYGWDGKELVLVPVDSSDYQEIQEKNKIIHNNEFIKAKDLILGATYESLNGVKYVYLGKFPYYNEEWNSYHEQNMWHRHTGYEYPVDDTWHKDIELYEYQNCLEENPTLHRFVQNKKNVFWFMKLGNPDAKYSWDRANTLMYFSTLSKKLTNVIDTNCHSDYITFVNKLNQDKQYSPIDFESHKIIDLPFLNFQYICWKTIEEAANYPDYHYNQFPIGIHIDDKHLKKKDVYYDKKTGKFFYKVDVIRNGWKRDIDNKMFNSIEELYQDLKPVYGEQYLENGQLYERSYYYGTEK